MAGGMGQRRDLGTLAERAAARRGEAPSEPKAPPLRHCWVTGAHGRLPGLLLGWEQRADGWHGHVVHPVHEPDGWVVVEEWLPAPPARSGVSTSASGPRGASSPRRAR